MLTKTPHLFDDATLVTAGDSCWQGKTSPDYWAFVGPFGGCTAATVLRALIDHPERAGDPLSLTVNFCAPIAEGGFDLDVRLVKANRSSQHWSVEMETAFRSEEHTSELQSHSDLVCRLLLEKKNIE